MVGRFDKPSIGWFLHTKIKLKWKQATANTSSRTVWYEQCWKSGFYAMGNPTSRPRVKGAIAKQDVACSLDVPPTVTVVRNGGDRVVGQ